jgi:hypothetical protein
MNTTTIKGRRTVFAALVLGAALSTIGAPAAMASADNFAPGPGVADYPPGPTVVGPEI